MIAIGNDHGGCELKAVIIKYFEEKGIEYKDFGTYTSDSCDYPEFGKKVAAAVASGECEKGILICNTGIGMSMVANKEAGVRAALCSDSLSARLTRLHNNANVLALGAKIIGEALALEIVEVFLNTPYSNEERHNRRISMYS